MLFFCVIKSIGYYFPVIFVLFLENIFAKFLDCLSSIFHLFFSGFFSCIVCVDFFLHMLNFLSVLLTFPSMLLALFSGF